MPSAYKQIIAGLFALSIAAYSHAAEISHFNGGFLNVRDYFAPPEPGFYGAVYNYCYTSDRLNDNNGDQINSKKEDFDITPGDTLTLNWGISQYIPLKKDNSLLSEIGPAGYDSWQVTEDSGSDASGGKDQVHGAGGQLGITYVPWNVVMNFHAFYEYASVNRFQGQAYGISIAKKF